MNEQEEKEEEQRLEEQRLRRLKEDEEILKEIKEEEEWWKSHPSKAGPWLLAYLVVAFLAFLYFVSGGFDYWDKETALNSLNVVWTLGSLFGSMIIPAIITGLVYNQYKEGSAKYKRLNTEALIGVWSAWGLGVALFLTLIWDGYS